MKINEVFDSTYEWEWSRHDKNLWVAEFRTKSGDELFVDFSRVSNNGWDGGFARNDLTKVTGEGDQFKIFATVLDVFKEFIEIHPNIDFLVFTAYKKINELGKARNKTTRENLYKRMVKTLASQYNLDYTVTDGAQKTKFKLIPKKPINEVSRPHSYGEAIDFLTSRGYEKLGSGKFATVFQRKSRPNEVIKIFTSLDSAYTSYLDFLMKNQDNKHFPKVYGSPMKITPDYYAVKLEKLTPHNSSKDFHKIIMHLDEFIATGYISEYLETYFNAFPSLEDAAERLFEFAHNEGQEVFSSDIMNPENTMLRGNTIVFTDPLYSSSDLISVELNEVTRPQTQEDADTILQDAGYERIGNGSFGAVYQKEGSNKVIKTFSSIDTSYIKFIKMVKKSNYNPHFPVFYGNPLKITDTYYGIKQEKLKPYNGNPDAISKYVHYLTTNYKRNDPDLMDQIEEIAYEYPRFKEACKMLADLMKNNPNIKSDIVKNNIMKRGNTIVFVDPVANAVYSKDDLDMLPAFEKWKKVNKKKKNWSKEDQEILDQLYSGGK